MNGLDLFSGIGGNSLALREWIDVVAYCEADRHAQAVLLSRMQAGDLSRAPIWDDVQSLNGSVIPWPIDIITAGFPCQDISVAGRGDGLEGKRSGLFFEIVRLAKEIQPPFVFLENVPAIRTRGLETVVREFSDLGYDCRWCTVSASQVGAPHKRERWFMLAANRNRLNLWDMYWRGCRENRKGEDELEHDGKQWELAYSMRNGCNVTKIRQSSKQSDDRNSPRKNRGSFVERRPQIMGSANTFDRWGSAFKDWWATEPNVGRVADGVPLRVERLKRLGNAVVPMQAKVAFEYLLTSKIPPKIDIDSGSVDGND